MLNALVGALGLQADPGRAGQRRPAGAGQQGVAGRRRAAGAEGRAARARSCRWTPSTRRWRSACAAGSADEVAKLVLTASGGPFRGWSAAELEPVTPEQAGAHPTWNMGPMNTLNSASLVNKGLELIETHLLFGVPYDRIEVVVHPQSIVHSMVTFTDGSTHRPGQPAGHETAHLAGAGLAGPGAGRGRGLRLQHRLDLGVRAAGRRGVPRRRPGPACRADAAAA